jgi:hypothetical protein
MKKNNTFIIGGVILLLISFMIYKIATDKNDEYKQVPLSTSNYITNISDKKYLDTIISVGLDELNLENIFVLVKPLPSGVVKGFDDQYSLRASIIGEEGNYIIFINNDLHKNEATEVISHELIHLKQLQDRILVVDSNKKIMWKNKVIDILQTPYNERSWEIDAFNKQSDLNNLIRIKIII